MDDRMKKKLENILYYHKTKILAGIAAAALLAWGIFFFGGGSPETVLYGEAVNVDISPETADEAKFSIHYSAAAALYTGNYTIGDLEQEPRPEVGMLAEKILLVPDPVMEDTARDIRGARLSVELSDGTVEEETVLLPKGEADNPMTWGDMERKLEACLEGTVCRAETLIRKLREVDMEARYEGITALL